MNNFSRRDFLQFASHSLLTAAVFDLLTASKALSSKLSTPIVTWLNQVNDLAIEVKSQVVSPHQWQIEMSRLLSNIDLSEFLKFIDFGQLEKAGNLPEMGEWFKGFSFPDVDGLPKNLVFYHASAGFRKGRSIPPHGHNNTSSSFVVLKGELHGRHFDRVGNESSNVFLRPSLDKVFKVGDFSTISDDKDNIHWFTALTEGAFMFDFGIGGVTPNWKPQGISIEEEEKWHPSHGNKRGRVYLDIENQTPKSDGLISVPRLLPEDAYRIYG